MNRAVIIALLLGAAIASAEARWSVQLAAEWGDVPANIRSWFRSVRSPNGVPCCDMADGHRTDYEVRSTGYWVPIGGEMVRVPDEAVVYNAGNPIGDAIVWYVPQTPTEANPTRFYIRCFVPGGGV